MTRRSTAVAAATVAAALAIPVAAQAHVTVNPDTGTAGEFTRLDVRVPNEQSGASTVKLQLLLPDGFADASYEPLAEWRAKVTREKLATPVQTDDGPVTEGVKEITWTGSGQGVGRIGPDQFMDFPLSVQIPEGSAGRTLTFKAIQTYTNGDVVRWIGAADSEHPAPTVKVAAASVSGSSGTATPVAPAASDGGGSDTIGVIALIVGGIGLVAAAAALVITRRPRDEATRPA